MDKLSVKDIKTLIEKTNGVCLSIYVPTFVSGQQVGQNQIRYKNLVRKAEEQLRIQGLRPGDVDEFLKPLKPLIEDKIFWRNQSRGLALFRSNKEFHSYRLPLEFGELAVVSDRFHLKPLVPLFNKNREFHLLAFSKGRIRLFRGSSFGVNEADLSGIPKSLKEALKFDVYSKELQYQTGAPRHGGRRDAIFFGSGSNEPDVKEEILHYFQQVDKGLSEYFADSKAPLVIAGVDYLIPLYKQANKYPHLIDRHISGNPDEISVQKLYEKAWELVAPVFYEAQAKALERFKQFSGAKNTLASLEIEEIVPAAFAKRVDTLFVANDVEVWGGFNKESLQINVHKSRVEGDEDLLDFAAVHTLLNGGTVYPMPLKKMFRQKEASAVFRY